VVLTVSPGGPATVADTANEAAGREPASNLTDGLFRLQDVIRIFREGELETIALRGIDLAIQSGSFVSLMGRSGSGKSTLLALLAGADRPSAGRVLYRDIDLGRAPESELQRLRGRQISLLFQSDNLVPFLSVRENLDLAARLAGTEVREGLASALLSRVGLNERMRHRPGHLSGGEQQRAALACVLAAGSPVLLMDEPTAELDSRSAQAVLDLVQQLQTELHLTVVLATHDRSIAARADRIVTLDSGHVTSDRKT
jgi:putative ABC transport system ATP-binding protein